MIATFNMIAEELSKIGADAISFYTMCSNFYCCIPIARKFKEICPNTPCLFAGPHATCIAREDTRAFQAISRHYTTPCGIMQAPRQMEVQLTEKSQKLQRNICQK